MMDSINEESILKALGFADILVFLGLTLVGVGLFLWFGIGPALTVVGALLLGLGGYSVVKG
jgi:hypothetical protein